MRPAQKEGQHTSIIVTQSFQTERLEVETNEVETNEVEANYYCPDNKH